MAESLAGTEAAFSPQEESNTVPYSNSLPSTPLQHARDRPLHLRTPSPTARGRAGSHSPRPRNTTNFRPTPSLTNVSPNCKFKSTQTSRRRMPYSIGADPLEKSRTAPKEKLTVVEEHKLTSDMIDLFQLLEPSADDQTRRERVVDKLSHLLNEEMPDKDIQVSMFGSSGNLLHTKNSDVDICITIQGLGTVCSLAEILHRRGMKNVTCVHAKAVPIVKIWDPELHLACDLNVNNQVALKNTRMVRTYMQLDGRVRPLAMIVKHWTKRRTINEASGGALSSYAWTLLLINFLQTRNPPILPVLTLVGEDGMAKDDYSADLAAFRDFGKANTATMGELLFQFFRHYGHEVNYETVVLSVRRGTTLTKEEKRWHIATNNRLCIEEPFNIERNLGNTADDTAVRGLHLEIREAFTRIANGEDVSERVCEQFEFPHDEPRPIFERPQTNPAPVLLSSANQSPRGSRSLYGGRGGANKLQNGIRNGTNNRRASSAATFAHSPHPILANAHLVMPNKYDNGSQSQRGLHDQLSELSHQLSLEEGRLRYQQLLMSHAQYPGQGRAHALNRGNDNGIDARRAAASGYTSPGIGSFDLPGSPATMYPGLAQLPHYDSSGTLQTSSLSATGTSSPSVAAPNLRRRGPQRDFGEGSVGAAARSQSQPARSMLPAFVTGNPGGNYHQNRAHNGFASRHDFNPPAFSGPFVNADGNYVYFPIGQDQISREYLGYSYGGALRDHRSLPDQGVQPFPVPENLRRPSRPTSPSSTRRTEEPSTSFDESSISAETLHPQCIDTRSASLPETTNPDSAVNHASPLIVNGSYKKKVGLAHNDKPEEGMNVLADGGLSDDERAGWIQDAQKANKNMSFGKSEHQLRAHNIERDVTSAYPLQYLPERRNINGGASPEIPSLPTAHSFVQQQDTIHRSGGDVRSNITDLDLNASHPAIVRTSGNSNSPLLSPVAELASPMANSSPAQRPHVKECVFGGLDFAAAARRHESTSTMVAPQPMTSSIAYPRNQPLPPRENGTSFVPPTTGTASGQSLGSAWQPVGKKGGKKGKTTDASETRSRGEPLPAKESERKGG